MRQEVAIAIKYDESRSIPQPKKPSSRTTVVTRGTDNARNASPNNENKQLKRFNRMPASHTNDFSERCFLHWIWCSLLIQSFIWWCQYKVQADARHIRLISHLTIKQSLTFIPTFHRLNPHNSRSELQGCQHRQIRNTNTSFTRSRDVMASLRCGFLSLARRCCSALTGWIMREREEKNRVY